MGGGEVFRTEKRRGLEPPLENFSKYSRVNSLGTDILAPLDIRALTEYVRIDISSWQREADWPVTPYTANRHDVVRKVL